MEYVIGAILLLSFFGLAFYCVKGYNLMMGFIIMATLWTVLPVAGSFIASDSFIAANPILQFDSDNTIVQVINTIFQTAPEGWGNILVNICFGSWFGRVLLDTGIASTLIRKTVELGGDKPIVTIALLNIVCSLIFTAMIGAGPTIAIGVIVLPILMSLGVPKPIAMFTFMGSVASGVFLNPVNFAQYRAYFLATDEMPEFNVNWYVRHWGWAAMVIMLICVTLLTAIYLKRAKTTRSWAAQTKDVSAQTRKDAPLYTLILPVVPVILKICLDFSVIGGFLLCGFLALFLCGRMKGGFKECCQLVNKLYYDGVVDTAPLIGFLLVLPMFNQSASYASPYFEVLLGNIMPKSELTVCIIFAALLFLGFFRGPLTLVGCGAATLGVLSRVGSFTVPFLYGVFAIPTITINHGCCITASWVAWGLAYTKVESRDYLKLTIPSGYLSGIIQYAAVYLMLGGLGAAWML